jgi:hypothetical protein
MEARPKAPAFVLTAALLFAAALPAHPQAGAEAGTTDVPDKDPTPIVRTDLLFMDREEPAPPLRDIFRPKRVRGPAARPSPRPPAAKTPAAPPPETAPGFTLELTYIGSVGVSGRTMALVLRRGQTVSVAEGDEVLPGYRVARITPDVIVVEGPNGERKTFTR